MIGKRNGKIKITSFIGQNKNRSYVWAYICDCGKRGEITTGEFNRSRGNSPKSCGCYRPITDLTGKTFGNLKVIKRANKKKGYQYFWECLCKCGNNRILDGGSLNRGHTKSCGCLRKEKTEKLKKTNKERILNRVKKTENSCWEWQGVIGPDGYGRTSLIYGSQRAHRSSYMEFKGEITDGLYVLHTCDNKKCVNPDHLYLGDAKQNSRDAVERGLHPIGPNLKKGHKGEKNCKSKLSKSDVLLIRSLYQPHVLGCHKLGKMFGVSTTNIRSIIKRKIWTHI